MAQFPPAFDYIMKWEDPKRLFAINRDKCPRGCAGPCYAVSGINSGAFPQQYKAIIAQPQSQRAAMVSKFYENVFWNPMGIEGIGSQDVASRVLDQGVNGGAKEAILLLQQAANDLGCTLTVDGSIGPNTLAAVNLLDSQTLLDAYRQARLHHYIAIVTAHPEDEVFESNWDSRALG